MISLWEKNESGLSMKHCEISKNNIKAEKIDCHLKIRDWQRLQAKLKYKWNRFQEKNIQYVGLDEIGNNCAIDFIKNLLSRAIVCIERVEYEVW